MTLGQTGGGLLYPLEGKRWMLSLGGRHGGGMNPDDMRAGRMLAQGDLRLIALALIAEEPRHGYEIIKLVEEKTSDWYSPSPGIVYPTLTYLEEAGYVACAKSFEARRPKSRYRITQVGKRALLRYLEHIEAVIKATRRA